MPGLIAEQWRKCPMIPIAGPILLIAAAVFLWYMQPKQGRPIDGGLPRYSKRSFRS